MHQQQLLLVFWLPRFAPAWYHLIYLCLDNEGIELMNNNEGTGNRLSVANQLPFTLTAAEQTLSTVFAVNIWIEWISHLPLLQKTTENRRCYTPHVHMTVYLVTQYDGAPSFLSFHARLGRFRKTAFDFFFCMRIMVQNHVINK